VSKGKRRKKEEKEKATRLKVQSWVHISTAIKTQSYSFLLNFSRSRAFPLTLKLFPLLGRLHQLIHKMGTAY
jgi:hypothetical protein